MIGDRRIIISNLGDREAELDALMIRFGVNAYRRVEGGKPMPDFWLLGRETDLFLAELRESGFEFEERAGRDGAE